MPESYTNGKQDPEQHATPGADPGVWDELHRAQQLASQISSWGGNLFQLAWLELQLALQSLPKMLGLLLALVPIGGLVWITLCMLLAWFAYDLTQHVAVGLGTLFGLQLLLMLLCMWQIKRLRARSSFKETRQQWQLFVQEMQQRDTGTREDHPANRH
jgi:uncharacterized membrane protein YqjE